MAESPGIVREAGSLVSYSMMQADEDRRVARYVDRILHGAKTAGLPVEQPTKFGLVINLKTHGRSDSQFRNRCCCVRTK